MSISITNTNTESKLFTHGNSNRISGILYFKSSEINYIFSYDFHEQYLI